MIDLRKNIIIVEGLDCSGKTELAKKLAEVYELDFVDNEYLREKFKDFRGREWAWMVDGINLQQAQFIKGASGLVKTRYSLTERVYRAYYQRKSSITPEEMESIAVNKVILLYIDLSYEKYRDLRRVFRKHEKEFTETEFNRQRELFNDAFELTCFKKKARLLNNSSFSELIRKACFAIDTVVTNASNNPATT